MRFLSLAALKVAFADLFIKRHSALILSSAGKTYEPVLLEKKALIDELPAALTGGKPLTDEITLADEVHDGFGGAIWYLVQAYQRWPQVPPNVQAAVKRIQAAFIPELDDLNASYVLEADAAIKHRDALQTLEADLKLIPIAGGLSLYDWGKGFVAGGDLVGTLLSQRADAATGTRSEAGKIRSSAVGVLGRFRGALGDELGVNPTLPKDLDAQVFGYFDELDGMRSAVVAAARTRKAASATPAATSAAPPAADPAAAPTPSTGT